MAAAPDDASIHFGAMETYARLGDTMLGGDPAIAPMYELIKAAAKATM